VSIKAMRAGSSHLGKSISRVELVGRGEPLSFQQTGDGLQVTLGAHAPALSYAVVLKIV
jgi:alpha-L-fucosidase